MPSPSPPSLPDQPVPFPSSEAVGGFGGRALVGRCRGLLSALAFWAAIVLPAVYLPLLVAGRLEPATVLAGVQAAMLLAGHGYGEPD